ncbi:FecR family protein [Alistipes finegoldii]|uniref:FecR family protein n=1 Tax=Alistipes finegoldii TaxID=214856 RepID=UPI0026660672|nr:FecR domain-containing protein [Alistipes finegoldii]
MTDLQINEEVLTAYLRGELNAAEAAAVEAWYDASAANRRLLGEIYYILYVNDRINDTVGIDVERSLRQFKRRMHAGRRISLRRITLRAAAAAAVAVILLAGGVTTVSLSKRLAQPLTVITHLGERSQVVLPDGTKVWLNSASSVEYIAPFFSRERRVKMDGEAYFEVQHDAQAPFVVSTNGLDIKVLGTRFNIRNDDNDHRITTVLLEGAVKAYASGDEKAAVRLRPSQQLVFDTRTGAMRLTDEPSADRSINWIDGRFCFEHDTFAEIVAELKRYYNVDIRFMDDALCSERFSGDFRVEDGIYHIMSVLQLTYKFTYKVVGNDIEIYPNPKR